MRAAALCIALLVAAACWLGTPFGLGLSPDSFAYLTAARGLLEHGDVARLPAHWPPGYPMLLTAGAVISGDMLGAARLMQAMLFGLNAILLIVLARRAARHAALALLLGVAVMLQPVLLQPHLVLWTEPAFLALMFVDWLVLLHCTRHPPRAGAILALAAIAGLALLLRYAGAHLLALNFLVLLILGAGSVPRRLAAAAAACLLGSLPLLAWLALRSRAGEAESVRALAWHPPDAGQWERMGATFAGWLELPPATAWPVLVAMALLGVVRCRRDPADPQGSVLPHMLVLAGLSYGGFVLLSASLFDAHIPFDDRILLPLFPVLVLLLVLRRETAVRRWPWLVLVGGLLSALALRADDGVRLWLTSRHDGIGLASRALREMPVMRRLASLPPHWHVATNGPELFALHLSRTAHMLPRGADPGTLKRNPEFAREMDALAARADAIVHFAPMRFRGYLPPPEVIDRLPGFRREYDAADATLWLRTEPRQRP